MEANLDVEFRNVPHVLNRLSQELAPIALREFTTGRMGDEALEQLLTAEADLEVVLKEVKGRIHRIRSSQRIT